MSDPDVEAAAEHLRSVMIPSETLEAWALQRRVFALTHRRVLVAATSGRLIAVRRRLIGGHPGYVGPCPGLLRRGRRLL